jgi:hypothetical protein
MLVSHVSQSCHSVSHVIQSVMSVSHVSQSCQSVMSVSHVIHVERYSFAVVEL